MKAPYTSSLMPYLRPHTLVPYLWQLGSWQVHWYKSTCFTGTKVQILTPEELMGRRISRSFVSCRYKSKNTGAFTGTKVQILTRASALQMRLEEENLLLRHY